MGPDFSMLAGGALGDTRVSLCLSLSCSRVALHSVISLFLNNHFPPFKVVAYDNANFISFALIIALGSFVPIFAEEQMHFIR